MSDRNIHKASIQVDEEIANGAALVRPNIIIPIMRQPGFARWMDDAFMQAQAEKERALGNAPKIYLPQKSPAISGWQQKWKTLNANPRELGPGDVK